MSKNQNYTDAERVLDYWMNPANYNSIFDCYDGQHGWDEEIELSDNDILTIIKAYQNSHKFMWFDNGAGELKFFSCVYNDGWGGYTAFHIEDSEAIDALRLETPVDGVDDGRNLRIYTDDTDYWTFFQEDLGWDDERLYAAERNALALFAKGGE